MKDHFKEFTFKPKINQQSVDIDFQNISQIYANMQKAQLKNVEMKQA